MVIAERKTSTVDECKFAVTSRTDSKGHYYFMLKNNPQIEITESGTVFFVPGSGQEALSLITLWPLTDLPIHEQCIIYAGQEHIREPSFQVAIDTVSTDTYQISAISPQVWQSVLNIFDSYQHEDFDTDIAYEFTNALEKLIRTDGKPAVRSIVDLIKKQVLNGDIVSETLKALGRIEDQNTKHERYELLIASTKNDSVIIRDGAVSGLSYLDDKRALPQLRMLYENEKIPMLKNNIKVAIKGF